MRFPWGIQAAAGLVAAVVCLASPARGSERIEGIPQGDWIRARDQVLEVSRKAMKSSGVVGLSLAVVDGERVAFAAGLGHADAKAGTRASPETIYRTGGVTALLTVATALRLVETGRLDLDAPVARYLPAFRLRPRFPDARAVTIRDLMTHHGGLPASVRRGSRASIPAPFETVVEALADEDPVAPPGRLFHPSEAGMALLGAVVQSVAGRPFAIAVQDLVGKPLGRGLLRIEPDRDRSPQGAIGHRKGRPEEEPRLRDLPAVGWNASVLDLARFLSMVLSRGRVEDTAVLQASSVSEMLRPQAGNAILDLDMRVGLGWRGWAFLGMNFPGAGPAWHLSGSTDHFHAIVAVLPAQGLAVAVMANSAEAAGTVRQVAEEALAAALQAKVGWRRPPEPAPLPDGPGLSPTEREAWEGDWATWFGWVRIHRKGDGLRCDALGRTFLLVPRTDGRLAVRLRLGGVIPVSLGPFERVGFSRERLEGREILVAEADGIRIPVGERLSSAPIPEAWARRTGEYTAVEETEESPELVRPALRVEESLLLVEFEAPRVAGNLRIRLPLVPLSEDEAVLAGVGPGLGEILRIVHEPDGHEVLRYSGMLLRRK